MLITRERQTNHKGYTFSFSGQYDTDPKNHWNPPIADEVDAVYVQPETAYKYSKILTDNVWVKDKWKDCQHHTKVFGDASSPSTLGFPWVARSITDIGHYTGGGAPFELAYAGLPFAVFGPLGNHNTGFASLLQDEELGDGFVPKPAGLSGYITDSLRAMMPHIKSELSLVNSVIELKDFRSLPHSLLALKSFITRLGGAVKRATKISGSLTSIRRRFSLSSPTMSEALGVGSDAYLQTQFNILPLLSDIVGISTAIQRTRARVNDLIVRQGKRQVKHFKLLVPSNQAMETSAEEVYQLHDGQFAGSISTTDSQTGAYASPSCSFKCVRELFPDPFAEFHAQVEFNYYFTRFQTENAQLLGLLDALGVNLNPAIIWNAIPWTFVVDWVINVSKWLSARTIMNMEPTVNISRYMWSWKYSRRTRLRMTANNELDTRFLTYTYLPDLVETIYRRQLDLPTKDQFLTGSGLNSKELSLGVALLITTGKHRRTRKS